MVYQEIRDHEDLLDPLERGDFRDLPDSREAKAALDRQDLEVLMVQGENKGDLVVVVRWVRKEPEVQQDSLDLVEDPECVEDLVLMAHKGPEVHLVSQVHQVNLGNAEA